MKYTLLVMSSPLSGEAAATAADFARAAVAAGHVVDRVFFYDEATYAGLSSAVAPQAEKDLLQRWQAVGETGAELVLCIASAVKRGLLDDTEATRHERPSATMHPAFTLAGLGVLVEGIADSDRLMTFG